MKIQYSEKQTIRVEKEIELEFPLFLKKNTDDDYWENIDDPINRYTEHIKVVFIPSNYQKINPSLFKDSGEFQVIKIIENYIFTDYGYKTESNTYSYNISNEKTNYIGDFDFVKNNQDYIVITEKEFHKVLKTALK